MAQKLHDQYVSEGEETRAAYIAEGEQTRDAYIAEGESKRAELISDGESTKEQLVSEGTSKRDELVNEGETRRTEILTDAETRAENMIEEAELTSTRTLNALERKKSDLESRVTELTGFERDYRARLRTTSRVSSMTSTQRAPSRRKPPTDGRVDWWRCPRSPQRPRGADRADGPRSSLQEVSRPSLCP
ncbi:hypothetical protein [Nesterenkonia pannonica]|uniref:hypothetical protein n=1 Tax=Nesterenkonia pannonica TaxID=1548602 RepID=UPI0021642A67|nr:hypothetical protein [Nesterenkonia pannonica]